MESSCARKKTRQRLRSPSAPCVSLGSRTRDANSDSYTERRRLRSWLGTRHACGEWTGTRGARKTEAAPRYMRRLACRGTRTSAGSEPAQRKMVSRDAVISRVIGWYASMGCRGNGEREAVHELGRVHGGQKSTPREHNRECHGAAANRASGESATGIHAKRRPRSSCVGKQVTNVQERSQSRRVRERERGAEYMSML